MVYTCGLALLAHATPSDRKGKVMGWVSMGTSMGDLNGPLVGGFLYRHGGHGAMFAVAMAIVGLDVILRLLTVDEDLKSDDGQEQEPLLGAVGESAYSATGVVQEHAQVNAAATATIGQSTTSSDEAERSSSSKTKSTYSLLLSQPRVWASITGMTLTATVRTAFGSVRPTIFLLLGHRSSTDIDPHTTDTNSLPLPPILLGLQHKRLRNLRPPLPHVLRPHHRHSNRPLRSPPRLHRRRRQPHNHPHRARLRNHTPSSRQSRLRHPTFPRRVLPHHLCKRAERRGNTYRGRDG